MKAWYCPICTDDECEHSERYLVSMDESSPEAHAIVSRAFIKWSGNPYHSASSVWNGWHTTQGPGAQWGIRGRGRDRWRAHIDEDGLVGLHVDHISQGKVPGPKPKTCGSCHAGICVMNGNEIQRCDTCQLFESDDDASEAVSRLLELLHHEYQGIDSKDTVADAYQRIRDRVVPPKSPHRARK